MYYVQTTDQQIQQNFKPKTSTIIVIQLYTNPERYNQQNSTKPCSYANVTGSYQSFKPHPTPIINNKISLTKFLHEFKSILNTIIF